MFGRAHDIIEPFHPVFEYSRTHKNCFFPPLTFPIVLFCLFPPSMLHDIRYASDSFSAFCVIVYVSSSFFSRLEVDSSSNHETLSNETSSGGSY
jgi:hypothetical protein